ncbi:hypothetical protein QLX08_010491 [Tetragonisca angustula]|uniref:Uncharacterized protein n=1 Tax=Tetragonisca angustula TaxID=166442 RepID=A0AAW0ZDW9_9HYME
MCDHCRTFKPLLEAANTTRYFDKDRPIISSVISPRNNVTPPQLRSNVSDGGCCSWRQTCCDGACCSRIGNCCPTGSGFLYQPSGRPVPTYGYGYDQPATSSYFAEMTGATMPDRVPCTTREKKLPMCFGGDCQDSIERADKPDEGELSPRQSER